MSPWQWTMVILVIVLLAGGVYLLTRRPTGDVQRSDTPEAAPLVDPDPVRPSDPGEGSYTDTATGSEVAVEDEDSEYAGDGDAEQVEQHRPEPSAHHGATTHTPDEHDPKPEVTYGSAPTIGEDATHAVPEQPVRDADNSSSGDQSSPAAFAAGSEDAPAGGASTDSDTGHPGPSSQLDDQATYSADQVGVDSPGPESATVEEPPTALTMESTDQGSPGPSSQPGDQATYLQEPETSPHPEGRSAELHHVSTEDEREARVEPSPYGPGTALPDEDGSGPDGWEIKGNAGSMLFHTPDSPSYADCRAEVWFESEESARDAGFAHWDRRQR